MAEYIDREALIKEIEKGIVFSGRLNSRMLHAELRGANLVIEKVKIAPAADVAPVVQSNWIRLQHSGTIVCGNCGRNIHKSHGNDYADFEAFCPSCGAKMDKQER